MRIVTPQEMKLIEDNGTKYNNMTYLQMMENAGNAAAESIRNKMDVRNRNCMVLCGKGNNGGDGFVVARKLCKWGANVIVLLTDGQPKTQDSQTMIQQLSSLPILILNYSSDQEQFISYLPTADLIVDAVYGSGFHGQLDDLHRELFRQINACDAIKIALDIPSGVNCAAAGCDPDSIHAHVTIAFDSLKPAHLFTKDLEQLGNVELQDIGIAEQAHENFGENYISCDPDTLFTFLKPKSLSSHKSQNGRLLNIAGSKGLAGAAVMSTLAALRTGAGYVTLAAPEDIYPNLTPHLITPVFLLLKPDSALDQLEQALDKNDALSIGCGLGQNPQVQSVVRELLCRSNLPMVIDADGINALSSDINIIKRAQAPLILTPHLGEFSRLTGKSVEDIRQNRILLAQQFAQEFHVVLVLKGANTIVASPDGLTYVNQTGNPGLAKAGSGDILTGIIASFIAQGILPFHAAVCGVYLHGWAANLCKQRLSEYAMQPTDLLTDLSAIFAENNR